MKGFRDPALCGAAAILLAGVVFGLSPLAFLTAFGIWAVACILFGIGDDPDDIERRQS